MYEIRSHLIEPALRRSPSDPEKLAAFIEAWETAKAAYSQVLKDGLNRPDAELARDDAYRQLLQAGLRIHRIGGSEAVGVVSAYLERCHKVDDTRHFQRLWNGLLPCTSH
ncbi:MAG: hypothetical protein FD150_1443 [Rhodobacteraceae bacterium]|nr:MAG: hypothetical protein FD150_1443 [Paracoccaceae bacterium]